MATETRATATTKAPEVDILAHIGIDRLHGRAVMTFQPSARVMEADGTTQAKNELGELKYERADAPAYSIAAELGTPEGVDRIVALEAGALARIVAATLTAYGATFDAQAVEDITTQLLHSGQGIDAAMTTEAETLRADLLARWDTLIAEHQAAVAAAAAADPPQPPPPPLSTADLFPEFGVRIDQGPLDRGPFALPG